MSSNPLVVTPINGEPRVHDLALAERLGFERPANIRNIIKRNKEKLNKFNHLSTVERCVEIGNGAKREVQEYYLNQKQAIFICMKSETERAFDVQIEIVHVFDAYLNNDFVLTTHQPTFRPEKTRKALPGGLTLEQQDAIKELIRSRVEALPHAQQAKAAQTCWAAIKSKFEVENYKAVPSAHFAAVLSLMARLPLGQETPEPVAASIPTAIAEELITRAQQAEISRLAHHIGTCFQVPGSGEQAAFALVRDDFGLTSAYHLPSRHFDAAVNRLEAAQRQADHYLLRKCKLDQLFLRRRFRMGSVELDRHIAELEAWINHSSPAPTLHLFG